MTPSKTTELEQRVEELEAQMKVLFQRTVGLVKLGPSPYEPLDSYGRTAKEREIDTTGQLRQAIRRSDREQG